jgi:GT2 family glycosyltransferase
MPANSTPLVSVIILNYNGAAIIDLVRSSIDGLRSQGYPRLELILVDDHSTDGGDALLRNLADETGATFTTSLPGRKGVSAARNAGLAQAHGELVAFLDNDAIPEPDWLRALVSVMLARPDVGACASRCMFADRVDVINSLGSVINELFYGNGVAIHQLWGHADWPEEIMYATGNGMMLRRRAMEAVGTFDEGYRFWGADDADYGFRLRRAGWRIVPVPEATVLHLHSYSKRDTRMNFWDDRNRVRMALKYLAWHELPAFVAHDVRLHGKPRMLLQYARSWFSVVGDVPSFAQLLRYRRDNACRGGFWREFARFFAPPHRFIVAWDNRSYAREIRPACHIVIGEEDEAYLYHGWYWPERWSKATMRWAMPCASLLVSLPQGAKEACWTLLPPPGRPSTGLRVAAQRREGDAFRTVYQRHISIASSQPTPVSHPMVLPPGEYRLVLTAENAVPGTGHFPRYIGFGLLEVSFA